MPRLTVHREWGELAIDFGVVAPNSPETASFTISNLLSTFTAGLDLDNVLEFGDPELTTDLAPFANLPAGMTTNPFTAMLDTTADPGLYSATTLIQLSDEDIPGVSMPQTLTLVLTGGVAIPGDANLDGSVDISDFNIWNSNKFASGTEWGDADFNFDGVTDISDFNIWNSNKFMALTDSRPVPEPSGLCAILVAMLFSLVCHPRRYRVT